MANQGEQMKSLAILPVILLAGCSRLSTIHETRLMTGTCNVIIGRTAKFDPAKSFQISIHPDSELQREYAIEAIRNSIDLYSDTAECSKTRFQALAELQKLGEESK